MATSDPGDLLVDEAPPPMPGDSAAVVIEELRAHPLWIPTDAPESDGTLVWDGTGVVVVEVVGGGHVGLGVSYTHPSAALVARSELRDVVVGQTLGRRSQLWAQMRQALRNVGRTGIGAGALSAVDMALRDLAGKVLDASGGDLLGRGRDEVPLYGSGGFTSYSEQELAAQLGGWVEEGFSMVKMKVGREPAVDPHRVAVARRAIGDGAQLFVDANGAYGRSQASALGAAFAEVDVSWFEEPVSSDDLDGLRRLRGRLPAGMEVAAGEYNGEPAQARRMVDADAVDVLQIDATRVGGYTGFMAAAAVAEAAGLEVSCHCAPALHRPVAVGAVRNLRHAEWFHDHVRIERRLFDGAPTAERGAMALDASRPGVGLELRWSDVARFHLGGHR